MMKKRMLVGSAVCVLSLAMMACSAEKEENVIPSQTVETEREVETEGETEKTTEADMEKVTENEVEGITFEDLSHYSYEFSSGAGGWSTSLEIEKDGTYKGLYVDSDMGDFGEGYEDGTRYVSEFSGKFKNLKKVSEWCYEMELDSVNYKNEVGTEEYADNVLYKYTEWYGLEGTDRYQIYLSGAPVSELSEEICSWLEKDWDYTDVLIRPILVNEPMQYAFGSYERASAKERAESKYQSYNSYYEDYLEEMLNAETTFEMGEIARGEYKLADNCLNELWHILKYSVSEEQFQIILEEQRAWIKEKDAKAEEIGSYDGSLAPVDQAAYLAKETMDRCAELLEYIKEYAE